MNEVASLHLCKELQELSHWIHDLKYNWVYKNYEWEVWDRTQISDYSNGTEVFVPAYSLGYLLRKLPARIDHEFPNDLIIGKDANNDWKYWASYETVDEDIDSLYKYADTPEDAACKLAIELFKQGILTKGTI